MLKKAASLYFFFRVTLVILIFGFLLFLITLPIGSLLQEQINRQIPGTLSWKDASVSLFSGMFSAENVVLADPDGKQLVRIKKIAVTIDWKNLLEKEIFLPDIQMISPEIQITMLKDGSTDLADAVFPPEPADGSIQQPPEKESRFMLPFNIRVRQLQFTDSRIRIHIPETDTLVHFDRLDLTIENADLFLQQADVTAAVKTMTIQTNGVALPEFSVDIRTRLQNQRLSPFHVFLNTGGSTFQVNGSVDNILDLPEMDLAFDASLMAAEIATGLELASRKSSPAATARADGTLEISGKFLGTLSAPKISMALTSTDLSIDIPETDTLFRIDQLDLTIENADLFLQQADITAAVKTTAIQTNGVALPEISADIRIGLQNQRLSPFHVFLNTGGSTFQVNGSVDNILDLPEMDLAFDASLMAAEIATGLELASRKSSPAATARADGTLEISGKFLGTLSAPKISMALTSTDLSVLDTAIGEIDLAAAFNSRTGYLHLDHLTVRNKNSSLELLGTLALTMPGKLEPLSEPVLDLVIKSDAIYLEDFRDDMAGRFSLNSVIKGSPENPAGQVTLHGRDILVMDQAIQDLQMDVVMKEHKVIIPRMQARLTPESHITARGWILPTGQNEFDLTVELNQIAGSILGSVHAAGTLNLTGAGEDGLNILVDGRFPVSVLDTLSDEIDQATGHVNLSAQMIGSLQDPVITADLELDQVGMSLSYIVQDLQQINGRISLMQDRIRVDTTGLIGDGEFDITGTADMNRYQPEQFHLELNTRNLYLDFPDLMEINISSRLILEGTPAGSMLNGEIILLEGRYDKDFKLNLTQMTQKQRTHPPRRQPPGISFFDRMALDIDIIRRAPFWIDNNIAWLSISPDLTLHGTVYRPLISGRARVDSGTIMFQKKEFEVLKGIIDFVNPYAIEPVIDIIGETQVRSWRIQLSLSGTPDNLNLQLSSVPQESHADIIALLAFGKTTRELRRSGSGDGLSPSDILAGFVADSLQPHVKETIGLDSVEIQADKRSDTGTYGGTVTLGKELSRQLSVKYGVGVKDGETVQRVTTDYKILENFWLSGFQETGGNFGGGLKYRLEFR